MWFMSPENGSEDTRNINCLIGKDYPKPIVDHATAIRDAKIKLYPYLKKDIEKFKHSLKI